MPEFLVVRLHSAAAETIGAAAEWIVMDGSGARRSNVQSGPLDLAVATAAGRKVIVLVPGTDALLAEPVLPVKSGAKLAQVVPFALEEHLAVDVDDLHFAVGKRDRVRHPVESCRTRGWMLLSRSPMRLEADAAIPKQRTAGNTEAITLLIDVHASTCAVRTGWRGPRRAASIESLQLPSPLEEARAVTIYLSEETRR